MSYPDNNNNVKKSWIEQPRMLGEKIKFTPSILLDETYEIVNQIKGLNTSLYPHQKTIVKAAIELEKNRTFSVRHKINQTYENCELKTTAGVISEAVGSGKTIMILSIILIQKIPKVFPDIMPLEIYRNKRETHKKYAYNPVYCTIVRKKFKNILTPTIIFAGVSVINQWVDAIKTFTALKVFAIFDVRDLQKLINMMITKSVNSYDIIVVKNGKITRPIIFPKHITIEDKNNEKTTTYIYNNLANMRNYCWARVVVDDFDTIHLPHNAGIVNGLFTWYISSTKKNMCNKNTNNTQFKTTADMLMYSNYSCSKIMQNPLLFDKFNIRNDSDFVKATNRISSPKFYAYVFNNPNNQYMGLMGLMGDDESTLVMEMLNGDAIETAAEQLGIKTNSVADIFQLMLGKQYDKYTKSNNVLEFIKDVEPMQGMRSPFSENPDQTDTYKKSDIFICRAIDWNYPNLKGLLDSTKEEYTEVLHKSSVAIERVKSNIKEGECPICTGDLADEDEETIIIKCCGIIVCGMCCFGTIFKKKKANGQCSNCRAQLKLSDLIYLNSSFDLDRIVDGDMTEEKTEDIVTDAKVKEVPRTKMNAIIDIIQGRKPKESQRVDVNIPNLMKGTHKLPEPTVSKVLIFANYDETIINIKTELTDNNIAFWKLGGTHREIAGTVAKFTNSTVSCVLIINSMKHCSGLNLQTATDLIFAHKMIDRSVETQVSGRAQRLGRTSNLKIHFMFYQNEFDWMVQDNAIRLIEDTELEHINPEQTVINQVSANLNDLELIDDSDMNDDSDMSD
jgi:hypothetical protein